MESPHILPNVKHDLSKQLEKLGPFVLREAMEIRLKKILTPCPSSPWVNDPSSNIFV